MLRSFQFDLGGSQALSALNMLLGSSPLPGRSSSLSLPSNPRRLRLLSCFFISTFPGVYTHFL